MLQCIARGRSNAELASDLMISEATAKTHVARILSKLELRDRVQVVVFAYEHGLTEPGARHHSPWLRPAAVTLHPLDGRD